MKKKTVLTTKKRAFTLVELLVVIAIIGVLIALLLPAVQAAREAGRRSECTNKVKQIALALQNYHSVHKYFPQGASPNNAGTSSYTSSKCRRTGWMIMLLPFMEQQAPYDTIQADGFPTYWNHSDLYQFKVASYLCPSDPASTFEEGSYGRTSFRACWGDAWTKNVNTANGYEQRGLFGFCVKGTVWFGLSAVEDGTSNTAFISEAGIGPEIASGSDTMKYREAIAMESTHGEPTGSSGKPRDCLSRKGNKGVLSGLANSGMDWSVIVPYCGRGFCDGVIFSSGFLTILPPNSPTCSTAKMLAINDNLNPIVSVSSYHSGGVNVAMVDGSVHFISDTIDCDNYPLDSSVKGLDEKPSVDGPSKYGLWGALGSMSGSETTSL